MPYLNPMTYVVFTLGIGENKREGEKETSLYLVGSGMKRKILQHPDRPGWHQDGKGSQLGHSSPGPVSWMGLSLPVLSPRFHGWLACCHAEAASLGTCLSSCLVASFGPPKYSSDSPISLLGVLSLTCLPAAQERPTNKRPVCSKLPC